MAGTGLGLTAQAFLLTIALGAGSSRLARLIASALALVVALMSGQLMDKHRAVEEADSILLQRLERALRVESFAGALPHAKPAELVTQLGRPWGAWRRASSYRIWRAGLFLFGAAAVAIFMVALISPSLLEL